MSDLELYKKRIDRERQARKEAENILEEKALELFTANERLQRLYKTKDELLEAISKALIVLFKEDNLQKALTKSIQIVGSKIGVDRFSIATVLEEKNSYKLLENYQHANEEFASLFNFLMDDEEGGKLFYKFAAKFLKGKKLVKFNSKQVHQRIVQKTMELMGLSSVVIMPIEFNGKIAAIISIELLDVEYDWSENDEAILLAYAAGVESVIEKFEARRKLEEQRSFYENVLNSIPSDLVVFDKDHRYKFVNPIAVKNPEIRSWLIDKDDFEYVEYRNKPKEIAEKRRAIFNEAAAGKTALNFEEKHIFENGEEEWKLRNLFPVFNKNDELEMMIGYALDITDIKKTNLELNTTSTRLSTLISSLNSGILLEDKNRHILVTNEEFCSIFGIPLNPKELIGVDCSNSAEQSKHLMIDPDQFVDDVERIVLNRKVITDEEIHFADGRIFERDFIPIYLEREYLGHLWEYRDITQKKLAEKELIRAREEAEESRRMKQKFLANMSHEIRTPMNGVVGIVHLLERTNLNDDQKKFLNILKDSSEHLLHIINDILDVSKLEEGKLVLNETPVQFDLLIEGVVQNLKSRVEDKRLELKISGLEIFDHLLVSDPVRIRQVLLNLLSNAIKFTHTGSVGIKCKTIKKTSELHEFNIEVWDTGIGISRENLSKIFNAFDQTENTGTMYGGTGLGLNIVQELIEKMGGKISVNSTLEKGSSFNLELALSIHDTESNIFDTTEDVHFDINALKDKTILVVDDHIVNYSIASEILKGWNASVLYSENGLKAISKLKEADVDLVLMDMQMPVMDGIEATKEIRQLNNEKAQLPIIAMTAAALPEERERCLQSGMNDYISKPYSPKILYQIITSQLGITDDGIALDSNRSRAQEKNSLYDLSYLRELSGDNEAFILEMVSNFKNEMPEMLDEMKIGFEHFDLKKVADVAHKAKSMASYIGVQQIRETLLYIEEKIATNSEIETIEIDLHRIEKLLQKVTVELEKLEL